MEKLRSRYCEDYEWLEKGFYIAMMDLDSKTALGLDMLPIEKLQYPEKWEDFESIQPLPEATPDAVRTAHFIKYPGVYLIHYITKVMNKRKAKIPLEFLASRLTLLSKDETHT